MGRKRAARCRAPAHSHLARGALALFLFLLIYDGAIRKWLVPGSEQQVFVAKDVLLAGATVFVFLTRTRSIRCKMPPFVLFPLGLYVVWVLIETLNPNLPNLLVGIWGSKSHLLYAALILLLPSAFTRLDDIFRMLTRLYPWIVVPVCGLAFLQLTLPATSILNQQVRGGLDSLAYFGEVNLVRVAGPFSYVSGMGTFIQVSVLAGVALLLWKRPSPVFLLALGVALAAVPSVGSRSAVGVAVVGGMIVLLSGLRGRVTNVRATGWSIVLLAVLITASVFVQNAAWGALVERTLSSRQDESRAMTTFTNALDHMDRAGLTGFGAGAANHGAVVLAASASPFSWLPAGTRFEQESGRLVLELGILGWTFSLLMRVALLWWAIGLLGRGANRTIRAAAVLVLPIMALALHQGTGVFAPPFIASYFWFSVAILALAQYEHDSVKLRTRSRSVPWRPFGARRTS